MKMENKHKQFNAFDRVLTKNSNDKWRVDFYSHFDDESNSHHTLCYQLYGTPDKDILPYEGNEHLVGSDQEPDEEIKLEEGEWVAYIIGEVNYKRWAVGKFHSLDNPIAGERRFQMKPISEKAGLYCESERVVRFSDFNPNDMEETKKHILCVKNGRIIRYKC